MVLIEVVELVVYINCILAVLRNMNDQLAAVAQRRVAFFVMYILLLLVFVGVSDRASWKAVLPRKGLPSSDWIARLIISHHLFPDLSAGDEQQNSQAQQHHSKESKRHHRVHRSWLGPPRWQILLLKFTCLQLINLLLDLLFFLRGCVHFKICLKIENVNVYL